MPGPWTKVVRLAHIELTNADAIFSAWLTGLLTLIPSWSLSERKRALALATSKKVHCLQFMIIILIYEYLIGWSFQWTRSDICHQVH